VIVPFKPSQVELGPVPLCATMGHAEAEFAAALIVLACRARGDEWQAVTWKQVGEVALADLKAEREPACLWLTNPFFRPDAHDLVKRGYARWIGSDDGISPVELTPEGIEKLRRWVQS
jgi:hypothetical protein